jgi:amino-acid N-acetyltransferase
MSRQRIRPAALPVLELTPRARLEQARGARTERHLSLHTDTESFVLRRAQPADAVTIHALLEEFVKQERLIPRTLDQVYRSIRDFIVAVEHGRIVGSGALRIYSDQLAEVAALAIAPTMQGHGIGRRIVEALLAEGEELGIPRIFALTTEEGFFHKLGFRTIPIAEFPEKIAQDCTTCERRHKCVEIAVLYDRTAESV